MLDIFPKEIADYQMDVIKKVVDSKHSQVVESISIIKGEKRWFNTSVHPIIELDGSVSGVQVIARDINDQKLSSERIRKEKEKAEMYLDVARVIMVVIGADQKVSLINKMGCEILGYSEGEIIGKNWFDKFLPDRIKEEVRSVFENLINGKTSSEHVENIVLTKNGQERIILWHNNILTDAEGNITGTLSSGEDITDRRKMESALIDSEEKFREVFNKVNDMITLIEIQENGRAGCHQEI
jgi:PAS domain S-box-containing protein